MAAGLQVYTDTGILQIDENTLCYGLRAKGTGTFNVNIGGATNLRVGQVVVTSAVAPMVAVRRIGTISLFSVSVSGSTWTYNFIGVNGGTFDWYAFDSYTPAMGAGTYGLDIYNSLGQLTYSTGAPIMRIVGVNSTGLSNSRSYAVVQAATAFTRFTDLDLQDGLGRYQFTASVAGVSQTIAATTSLTAFFTPFENYFTFATDPDYSDPLPGFFVVDVTNL